MKLENFDPLPYSQISILPGIFEKFKKPLNLLLKLENAEILMQKI
jgi:hypothetical protein